MNSSIFVVAGMAALLSAGYGRSASADPAAPKPAATPGFSVIAVPQGMKSKTSAERDRQPIKSAFGELGSDKAAARAVHEKDRAAVQADKAALAEDVAALAADRATANADKQKLLADRAAGNHAAAAADRARLAADRQAAKTQREKTLAARKTLHDQRAQAVADHHAQREIILGDHAKIENARVAANAPSGLPPQARAHLVGMAAGRHH